LNSLVYLPLKKTDDDGNALEIERYENDNLGSSIREAMQYM